MPAEIVAIQDGVVSLRISGLLTQAELAAVQARTAAVIDAAGPVRILVLAEWFTGWEQGGQWDDFSFQDAYDRQIGRMAIVGDERWRDLALLFTAGGMRGFPIRFFTNGELADARAWVSAATD